MRNFKSSRKMLTMCIIMFLKSVALVYNVPTISISWRRIIKKPKFFCCLHMINRLFSCCKNFVRLLKFSWMLTSSRSFLKLFEVSWTPMKSSEVYWSLLNSWSLAFLSRANHTIEILDFLTNITFDYTHFVSNLLKFFCFLHWNLTPRLDVNE